jgi:hypothetical protein
VKKADIDRLSGSVDFADRYQRSFEGNLFNPAQGLMSLTNDNVASYELAVMSAFRDPRIRGHELQTRNQ